MNNEQEEKATAFFNSPKSFLSFGSVPFFVFIFLLVIVSTLAGFWYGSYSSQVNSQKAKAELEQLKKQTAPQIAYSKYIVEPQKIWPDLVNNSSLLFYATGKIEKNLPAQRPAESGSGILRGREITIVGSKGSKMTFFVNEADISVNSGTRVDNPKDYAPYPLSQLAINDNIFVIVKSPVLQRQADVTDIQSLNLRASWILKLLQQ